ncbi:ABC transporter permease [Xanthomonas translucens]|uniref:ABC transporter permease n=2 Tax=Xanthomonas campestris pv. translucens TaxID=343 RepID=UPI0002A79341|nr:FtsX-like permease family protein [Xanthomonas translucens]AKK69024.1 ABC transporter permease [Xanthomonas translucens pv. undulosa]ELQ16104.1 ABC transporter permease [Xanthomonas translucens DAR61454]MBC3973646.1 FtsX-like permease family protein [Xanthomonas translucens pv. undulosa]MCT8269227.1 FtsX-like permease family protein [Xanthomonas translucens pv. undulosa]MCT8280455.1 FtsX-like permease family protein [Xanthomonas translucens pv. undulosa]
MNLPIRPILSSLHHHRLTAALLMLQVALTCAFVANAVFLIGGRIERLRTPSGLPEDELSLISVRGLQGGGNAQAQQQADLLALRSIPGVKAATAFGFSTPLSGGANDYGGCADRQALERASAQRSMEAAGCIQATYYTGSPGFVQAMGARLIAGRDFHADEYSTTAPSALIVTRTLAQQLWPGQPAVGKTLYGDSQVTVVGVVDDLLRPTLRNAAIDHLVALSPQLPAGSQMQYLLRSAAQDRDRVLAAAAGALAKAGPLRLIPNEGRRSFAQLRQRYFQHDASMIGLLLAATTGLLFVTALGIGGLASFWVQQRTRQIGIRRAIGATRRDIRRYFQTENLLIVGSGSVLGMALAVLLNQALMRHYDLSRLPLGYLAAAAMALLSLGQLAVLWPAQHAAAVPPAVATRST